MTQRVREHAFHVSDGRLRKDSSVNYPWFHRLIKVSYARYDIRVVAVLFCRRRAATRLQNPTHLPLAIRPGQV